MYQHYNWRVCAMNFVATGNNPPQLGLYHALKIHSWQGASYYTSAV